MTEHLGSSGHFLRTLSSLRLKASTLKPDRSLIVLGRTFHKDEAMSAKELFSCNDGFIMM